MKNLFLVVLALCVYIPQANAQKVKDQEFRRVVVTLTSGEKVEGYVKRGWHAEASAFKKSNYSFKMTATPDDKEVLKYTADEVVCIDYTEKTENNPDGIRWESRELASPSIADRYRTIRRLVCLENTGEHASVYGWKDWDVTTNQQGMKRRLVTYHGIRFHDEGKEGEIIYTPLLLNSVLLKDKKPGLKEFCKNWFKGKEGKARKKEADADGDGTWMLDMYEAYLAQQAK